MFLPVKADVPLARYPVLTILVCLVCFGVFINQQMDRYEFGQAMDRYCDSPRSRLTEMAMTQIAAHHGVRTCGDIMYVVSTAGEDESLYIEELAENVDPLAGFSADVSREYVIELLNEEYQRYRREVGPDPDESYGYYTASWNPWHMITASFSHGGWAHLIFNLIFFFAFAATVEALIGSLSFVAVILAISFVTGIFTSFYAITRGYDFWSLGLSGIVMGMIGLYAYLLPRGKIRCYYWFIVIFGSIAIPGWALALWYIGGDMYQLAAYEDHGLINVMAHVSGGVGGFLFGALFLKKAKHTAEGLQMEMDRARLKPEF